MSYFSVASSFDSVIWNYFRKEKEDVSSSKRITAVIITPIFVAVSPILSVIDGLHAIIRGVAIALTNDTASYEHVITLFKHSSNAQSLPFDFFVSMLHPDNDIDESDLDYSIHENVTNPLEEAISEQLNSKSLFRRHIVSRSLIFVSGIVGIIARVVAFPIGLIAAVFATLARGRNDALSEFACQNISITGIVADIGKMVIQLIRPNLNPTFLESSLLPK